LPGKGPRGTTKCKLCKVRKPSEIFVQTQVDGTVKHLKTCPECREKLATSSTVRKCIYCKHVKDIAEFKKVSSEGLVKSCLSCRERIRYWAKEHPEVKREYYKGHAEEARQRSNEWYYANRECELEKRKISRTEKRAADPESWRIEQRGYQKKWLSKPENKKKRQEQVSAWMKTNRPKMNEAYKRWYVKNQDLLRKLSHQRIGLYGRSNFSFEEWLQILDRFEHCCAYCHRSDVKLTMDHVVPVSCGGEHIAENIVPACKSCNSKKGNRPVSIMFDKVAQ
jgi:5-methylcytosine-specific restriction endonuclease McrA